MLHEREDTTKNTTTKTPQRCANRNAHMKKPAVVTAADYIKPDCLTLQHALVNTAQVNLFWREDIFNMLSCLADEDTTTALTFHSFGNVRAQSGLTRHARSSKNDVFFENVNDPADKTKTCWTPPNESTALSRLVDCISKSNIWGSTNTYMLRPARCNCNIRQSWRVADFPLCLVTEK